MNISLCEKFGKCINLLENLDSTENPGYVKNARNMHELLRIAEKHISYGMLFNIHLICIQPVDAISFHFKT